MGRFRIDRTAPSVVTVVHNGSPLVANCHVADRWIARLVGLLGTPDLAPEEGLWITPCRSVHTWGMRAAIACAFVDGDGRVLRVVDPLAPRRSAGARGARSVLEARAGCLAGVRVGDVLVVEPAG
jgi:uncharacterized protein